MPETKTISALVVGGEASAGPPLGPSLGPLGVNVMAIVKEINEQTKNYAGMRIPIRVIVQTDTKQFTVEVGTPTSAALIVKESGIAKGSGTPKATIAGNLSVEQLARIAAVKISQSYGSSVKTVAKEVSGTCLSMGVTIEGKQAQEFIREVNDGTWDESLSEKAEV